jgi:hypothetical protein
MQHIDTQTGSRSVRGNQQFPWKHSDAGRLWLVGQRHCGCVGSDPEQMQWSDGRISDRTNLTRAKDALSRFVESEARRLRGAADTIRKPSVRPADASSYEGVAS